VAQHYALLVKGVHFLDTILLQMIHRYHLFCFTNAVIEKKPGHARLFLFQVQDIVNKNAQLTANRVWI